MRKNKKIAIIISGGKIETELALAFLREHPTAWIIGVDRGLGFLQKQGVTPTHIVGDFDSVSPQALAFFRNRPEIEVRAFRAEKDATDTQIAVELALELDSREIWIFGGTGSRLDHVLANLRALTIPAKRGIACYLTDSCNRIRVVTEPLCLKRAEQYGSYVSLFALAGNVEGITLTGFKYPLSNYRMTGCDGIGVSNEITAEQAEIAFDSGLLVVVESRD